MRGRRDPQATMLAFVDLEERVPKDPSYSDYQDCGRRGAGSTLAGV